MTFARRTICGALAGLTLAVHAVSPTLAASKVDGTYNVQVTTEEGPCDKVYTGTLVVADGRVTSTGDVPAVAAGIVDSQGVVSLSFSLNNQSAHAAGKVSGRSGKGTWSSGTAFCGGRWRAERQG